MEKFPVDDVSAHFDDVINLVANGKKRVLVQDATHVRAALISLEDLAFLENLDRNVEVPVEHVDADEVRRHLREDLAEVASRKERIIVTNDGKDLVALVPNRDLNKLELLDQSLEMEAAKHLLDQQLKRGNP